MMTWDLNGCAFSIQVNLTMPLTSGLTCSVCDTWNYSRGNWPRHRHDSHHARRIALARLRDDNGLRILGPSKAWPSLKDATEREAVLQKLQGLQVPMGK